MEMLETLQNASSRMREDEWGREQGLEAECGAERGGRV